MMKHFILVAVFVLFGRCIQSTGDNVEGFFAFYDVLESETGLTREQRFPSVEERLQVYMSNWYIPPCEGYNDGLIKYSYNRSNDNSEWPSLLIHTIPDRGIHSIHQIESIIEPDRVLFLDTDTARDCASARNQGTSSNQKYNGRVLMRENMFMYCVDVADTLMTALDHVDFEEEQQQRLKQEQQQHRQPPPPPTLMQFGDLKHSHVYRYLDLPHFKKFRSAARSLQDLEKVTTSKECWSSQRDSLQTVHSNTNHLQPLIWKFATSRHFSQLDTVRREDTPWKSKINKAIFRGQLTGSRDGYDKLKSDEENCMNLRRCRLVYTHANSTLVHAKLTSTRSRLPTVLNGVNLMASSVTIRRLLEYKAIIMLEGNDVASGLKWALLSQSVVLMPPPKHTSWAMEELLQPWVHYIPLNQNASDVEEKMSWVIANDRAAQRIAQRSSLWMEDLCFHPDALEDDRRIQEEMIRRYRTHFQS